MATNAEGLVFTINSNSFYGNKGVYLKVKRVNLQNEKKNKI